MPALLGLGVHSLLWLLVGGYADKGMGLSPVQSLAGLAVGLLPMVVVWRMGGVGAGDAKLMGAVGALGGWRFALATMFYGLLVAGLMAIVVILLRRRALDTLRRIGTALVLLLGRAKPGSPAQTDSPTVPLGLALAIGAAAACIEVLWRGTEAAKLILGI